MTQLQTLLKNEPREIRSALEDDKTHLVRTNVKDAILTEMATKKLERLEEETLREERRRALLFADAMNSWARTLGLDRNLSVSEVEALAPEATHWHRTFLWKSIGTVCAGIALFGAPVIISIIAGIFLHQAFFIGALITGFVDFAMFMCAITESGGPFVYFFEKAPTTIRKALSFLRKGYHRNENPELHGTTRAYSDEDIDALKKILFAKNRP